MLPGDQDLLAEVVANHWQAYRKRLRECHRQLNEDSVHKLRISLRRLLALIDLLLAIKASDRKSKLRKQLKAHLSALSELRDLQVMRLETTLLVGEYPQLQDFLHQLHLRELELLIELPKLIASWRSGKLKRKINKLAQRKQIVATGSASFAVQLVDYLERIFQQIADRQSQLDDNHLATYHKLRIVIKRLRYTLELAGNWLPNLQAEQLALLKSYQDLLGEIQNGEVFIGKLESAGISETAPSLRQSLLAKHRQLLTEFNQLQQQQPLTEVWRDSIQPPLAE